MIKAIKKIIFESQQSPGDICMVAYAIKCLHEAHPGEFLTGFRGTGDALMIGSPYITPLVELDGAEVVRLGYDLIHHCNDRPLHFAHAFMADIQEKLGVTLFPAPLQGFLYLTDEEKGWINQVEETTGNPGPFWIINAGHKSDFTAKQWAYSRYQEVVKRFPDITFAQIGQLGTGHEHPTLKGSNVVNLVGKTDLRQLVRLVWHSAGVICPVTAVMHMAYGLAPHPRYHRRSRGLIVVAGGREPPLWQATQNGHYLHTCGMLPCCDNGGCWKSRTVKLNDGDKQDSSLCVHPVRRSDGQYVPLCLEMITVDDVCRHIERYESGRRMKA